LWKVTVEAVLHADDVLGALERDGYAVVPRVFAADAVARARAELTEILAATPYGRDDFEGRQTRRVYSLFAKTRALDAFALHPLVQSVLDGVLGQYQFSSPAGIEVGPGERAQVLHADDAIYPVPRPHAEMVATVMCPLDEFTEANGATRIIPGSHRYDQPFAAPDTPTIAAEMQPGDALFYTGSVLHGGGANTTSSPRLGVVLHFCAAWLRSGENHTLAVPRETAAALPQRLQELLGYNVHPPFIGYVDGRHPRRVLGSQPEPA
jgi:ectoine hydroxylase-related dioxygenase (phytanoyl-CoA dioxygenase family)